MDQDFGTRVIGQTEKALNALLARELAGTGVTEPRWVALTLAITEGGTGGCFVGHVAGVLKTDEASADEHIAALEAAGLLRVDGADVMATEAGRALWDGVRASIARLTRELWGDLPPEDLAVAGRVLNTVLGRANTLLAA